MNNDVVIKEATLQEIADLEKKIPEFARSNPVEKLDERIKGRQHLAIIAYVDDKPVGYSLSYNRLDNGALYCWIAAVLPEFRRQGVYKTLAKYRMQWAKDNEFSMLRIKTRNQYREILSFLVQNNWMFDEIKKSDESSMDNEIYAHTKII